MRIAAVIISSALVVSGALISAPSSQARGLADCFSASGSRYPNSMSYEIRIVDNCGFVSSDNPSFSNRVNYTIDVGAYCFPTSGTIFKNGLGVTERIDIGCLTASTHTPTVTFQSFADRSYKTVQLPFLTIRKPETPQPVAPTPTRTPTPLPNPIVPAPTQTPAAPMPSTAMDFKTALPGAISASYATKRKGTGKPTARLEDDQLTVRISTNLKPRSQISVEVQGPQGIGNVAIIKPGGVTEIRAFQDWYNFPVGKRGQVEFTVPVTAANDIIVRDRRGKKFLRLYTSSSCLAESRFTLSCSGRP